MRESQEQNNCSLAYAEEIAAGRVYLYSVHHPERATLAIRKDEASHEWGIQEVRAAGNAAVSADTVAYVHSWFAAALVSAGLETEDRTVSTS